MVHPGGPHAASWDARIGTVLAPSREALGDRAVLLVAALAALGAAGLVTVGAYLPGHAGLLSGARAIQVGAALLSAAIAALAVADPWSGLLAWVILLPLVGLARAQVAVGGLQLIVSTVLLAALVAGCLVPRGARPRPARADRPTALASGLGFLLAVSAILASFYSADRSASAVIALHGIIEPAILAVVLVALRPSARQLRLLALAMVASVAIATVINLGYFADLLRAGRGLIEARALFARLTYFNVGIFGDLLVMALPMSLGAILVRVRIGLSTAMTALLTLAGALLAVALYLSFTKSAWIGAAAALVVFLLGLPIARRWRLGALALLVLASALVVPYGSLVSQLLTGTSPPGSAAQDPTRSGSWDPSTPDGEVSITERVYATEAAVRMTIDHPLLGVGPGGFQAAYAGRYHPAAATRLLSSAHDFLPNVAAELGLPALAVVVAAILAALIAVWGVYRRGPPGDRILALSLLASLVGFLVVATTFGLDFYRPNRVMNADVLFAALLVGACVALPRAVVSPDRPATLP